MGKKVGLVAIIVLLIGLFLAACSGGGSSSSGSTSIQTSMSEFAYSPNSWTVPAGQKITLTLVNKGTVEHDWVLMKESVTPPFSSANQSNVIFSAKTAAGATNVVTFTAPSSAGEYEVVCDVPGHLEAGMMGKLTVVQP
ncbi:MAG TPA: plastocyanin/azurin family copper-binding protein [Anaerolineaceae bacterium]|nr:plastocyanin/azurin family copper-binding protein [Anaerolineaceae bacterium]